ncbi:MAG: pyridoxal-5'-phosphate-dependent protein [Rhodospirillaceae bacterium TMED8]|nr:pyridoxal-5'-phosphate-dependent protein [Magnetovibrio sp.]OUT51720.1 MAG: pyridoxal-5'-phosphate-dependent protein [Rhodospirillaceae bacterium TMED8]
MPSLKQNPLIPGIKDIRAAAHRLSGWAVWTPLLESPHLNEMVEGRLLIKAECLQRTGAFKFRGAFNMISQIPENIKQMGVVSFSSGNHAQGVAHAAKLLGIPAILVMPDDAPTLKIENTRGYGAEVRLYDRTKEDREIIASDIAKQRDATLVKPYDDAAIIAGQGTVGLEISEQFDGGMDQVLCCVGGGGLAAGTAIAIKAKFPNANFYAVEPEGFDSMGRSLRAGELVGNKPGATTICDSLMPPKPGVLTFAVAQEHMEGGVIVSDADVKHAMRQAFLRLKLVVEPGGAAGLAAALSGRVSCKNKTTVVICSGGNVDRIVFANVLNS